MSEQKRQNYFLGILAFVIIIGIATLWINRSKKLDVNNAGLSQSQVIIVESVDLGVLNSERFRSLVKWGEYPVGIADGETNRSNPFIPFLGGNKQ